jgi:UDP-N-acetylmuramate--alanine ligase
LAAFAAMRSYGFGEREIVRGLESFTAVKRRFEELGKYRGCTFISDYAHHPKELFSTLQTARKATRRKLYVVFQPHTYSRTKFLMNEFVEVLSTVKNLIVYQTYAARERYDESGSAKTLANRLGSLYAENVTMLKAFAENTLENGDCMLFLGAGDIHFVAKFLLKELNHTI